MSTVTKRMRRLMAAWKITAEVHADPELATILRQDAEDLGPAPTSS
ncbi:hypothetical protein [Amycolatopsis japonica]